MSFTCRCVCVHVSACVCVCECVCVHACVCMHVSMCVSMSTFMRSGAEKDSCLPLGAKTRWLPKTKNPTLLQPHYCLSKHSLPPSPWCRDIYWAPSRGTAEDTNPSAEHAFISARCTLQRLHYSHMQKLHNLSGIKWNFPAIRGKMGREFEWVGHTYTCHVIGTVRQRWLQLK